MGYKGCHVKGLFGIRGEWDKLEQFLTQGQGEKKVRLVHVNYNKYNIKIKIKIRQWEKRSINFWYFNLKEKDRI